MGTAHPLNGPYQAFQASDGWITVGAANQANWLRLIEALEAPELGKDPRFATNSDRMRNLPELAEALTAHFKRRTSADWLQRLEKAGVPASYRCHSGMIHLFYALGGVIPYAAEAYRLMGADIRARLD